MRQEGIQRETLPQGEVLLHPQTWDILEALW